jgi:catechol 2,3-dioxygenase-like lactoylglutathione lyase family enzyme
MHIADQLFRDGERPYTVTLRLTRASELTVQVQKSTLASTPLVQLPGDTQLLTRVIFDLVRRVKQHPDVAEPELQHVTLFYPHGRRSDVTEFYSDVLGLTEVQRPANVQHRDGAWFRAGSGQVHLTPDADLALHPRRHFGLRVESLDAMASRLASRGIVVERTFPFPGWKRAYCYDPFGNKVELDEIDEDERLPVAGDTRKDADHRLG